MVVSSMLVIIYAGFRPILQALFVIDTIFPHVFLKGIALCGVYECFSRARDYIERKTNGNNYAVANATMIPCIELLAAWIALSMAVNVYIVLVAYFSLPRRVLWNFITLLENFYSALVLLVYLVYRMQTTAYSLLHEEGTEPNTGQEPGQSESMLESSALLYDTFYDTYMRIRASPKTARM